MPTSNYEPIDEFLVPIDALDVAEIMEDFEFVDMAHGDGHKVIVGDLDLVLVQDPKGRWFECCLGIIENEIEALVDEGALGTARFLAEFVDATYALWDEAIPAFNAQHAVAPFDDPEELAHAMASEVEAIFGGNVNSRDTLDQWLGDDPIEF